jgi:hypothetical protein
MADWDSLARRAAFASHQLIGWIFWDPRAQQYHKELGVQDGMGHYIANRAAPLAAAGIDAVYAAFYTIKRQFIHFSLDLAAPHGPWTRFTDARARAVWEGLQELAPEICEPLGAMAPELWRTVDAIPEEGRVLFAAHRSWPRHENATISAWEAINCLREWRGDVHFALLVNEEIDAIEAGLLHDAWMGYPNQWIPRSRGADDAEIERGLASLEKRGFVTDGVVNDAGVEYRQWIEDRTTHLCSRAWQVFGEQNTESFIALIEPVGQRFVDHINSTAGENWMPAARPRRR